MKIKFNIQLTFLFILSFLLFSEYSFSQNLSKPERFDWNLKRVLAKRDGDVFFVAQRRWRTYFVKADLTENRLKLLYELPMESKEKEDINFIDAVVYDDKVIFMAYIYNKKKKEDRLYAMTFDWDGIADGDWKRIDKAKAKKDFKYEIIKSKHSNEFLLEKIFVNDKKEPVEVSYVLYDSDVKVVYNHSFKFDEEYKYFDFENHYITKSGRVYIIGSYEYEKDIVKERRIQKKAYIIYSFDPKKDGKILLDKIDFAPSGKYISKPFIYEDAKGQILITGGYGNQHDHSGIYGIFNGRINPEDNTVVDISLKKFSKPFVALFSGIVTYSDLQYIPGYNTILYYHVDDAGNKYFVGGEKYVLIIRSTSTDARGNTTTTTDYQYHNQNYFCLKFSAENDFLWSRFIPISIMSMNDGDYEMTKKGSTGDRSDVKVRFNNGNIDLIFASRKINKDNEYSGIIGGKKDQLIHAKVSADGDLKFKTILSNEELGFLPLNKFTAFIDENKILVYGRNAKKPKNSQILYLDL